MPATLGSYPIERELGRGGMGVVYLGRDPRLDRQVAIKVLSGPLAQQPEHLARFEREAKLLASLNHPNIAAIYGVEQAAEGQQLLVLEYVPGETLADRIARGPLPIGEAIDICGQIAAAVEVAHDGGIIHRDLKPGNVKITPEGVVKVLDFGLAKGGTAAGAADMAQSPTFTSVPTAAGVILGTAGYMSPEQARGRPVDKRTDIWSFGCVLYECLAGRRIFDGETISDTIAHILQRDPDWSALPAATPPRVRELLRRCLEKDVRKRQRDIGDVRLELDAPSPPPVEIVGPARSARGWHTHALPWIALGVVVGAAGWAVLSRAWTGSGEPAVRPLRLSVTFPPELRVDDYRLTPDGSRLILDATETAGGDAGRRSRLYVRALDDYAATPIAGTEGVVRFEISPSGRWLAVLTRADSATREERLLKIPLDGTAPAVELARWDPTWLDLFRWRSDDELLAIAAAASGGEQHIVPISAGTGAVGAPIGATFAKPGMLTGIGRNLGSGLFVQVDDFGARGYQTSIWVFDPATGSGAKVLENAARPLHLDSGHLVFSRDSTIMAARFDTGRRAITGDLRALVSGISTVAGPADFEVSDNGTLAYAPATGAEFERRLVVVGASGSASQYVPGSGRFTEMGMALTPDGSRAALTVLNETATYEVWIADAPRSTVRRTIASPNADASNPVWSPAGDAVAFWREGLDRDDGIYVQRTGGGDPQRISAAVPNEYDIPTAWLPDGSALIVTKSIATKTDLVLQPLPASDGTIREQRSLRASAANEKNAVISSDGRLVAFASDHSGETEIYVATFEAGALGTTVPVSRGACDRARWAPGSRRLYFCDATDRLMTVDVSLSPSLSASMPATVLDLTAHRIGRGGWDVTSDGRVVAIQRAETEGALPSLNIVINWLQEIRAALPR
jgi:hypothetical protein